MHKKSMYKAVVAVAIALALLLPSAIAFANEDEQPIGSLSVSDDLDSIVAVANEDEQPIGPLSVSEGSIVAWGRESSDRCNVPAPNSGFTAVAGGGGGSFSLGLKSDGSIVAWGSNSKGQCDVPAPNSDFTAVAGGSSHGLGLKSDGSIVGWGYNYYGQCDVPAPNSDFTAIAGYEAHSVGLKSNGSIVVWGKNTDGQCDVPAPNSDFTAVAAGWSHSLGLKSDGSIVAWGSNYNGQCDVPAPNSDFTAVGGGGSHSLGLKADGSIVAWGYNVYGQCDVPAPNSDFTAVAAVAGNQHSLGLKADGSIVAWGDNEYGMCEVPAPNSDFIAVAAGSSHSLGLKRIIWDATLSFSETGGNIDSAVFGEAPDACDGATGSGASGNDAYDVQKAPAPMQPYLRASFDDGLSSPFDSLQADYRQYPDTSKVWNLSVQWMPTSYVSTNITITWNTSALVAATASEYNSVVLFDVSASSVVADMLVDSQYIIPDAAPYGPISFQIIATYVSYTLTVITDGTGSGSVALDPSGGIYEPNVVVELTATPGSVSDFIGWSGDLTGSVNPDNITMDGDKTVTATFNLKEYTLTLNTDGTGSGTFAKVPNLSTYPHGTSVEVTAIPDSGSEWIAAGAGWTEIVYSGTGNWEQANLNYLQGGTGLYMAAADCMSSGNIFDTGLFTPPLDLTGLSNVTLEFEASTYFDVNDWAEVNAYSDGNFEGNLVTYTDVLYPGIHETLYFDPSGYTDPSDVQIEFYYTTNGTDSGYFFLIDDVSIVATGLLEGFEGAAFPPGPTQMAENPTTILMDGDKTVTATFTLKEYTLTVNTDGTGSGTVTEVPDLSTHPHGSSVQLTANPDFGSDFIVWSGDLTGSVNPDNITMDGDKTVTATFDLKEYTLTLNTDGTGSGTVTEVPDLSTHTHGTSVQLTANPNFDSDFIVWSGDLTGSVNPDTILMDSDKTVTATFNLKEYTLTATVDPSGSGSVILNPPGGVYEHGTDVTLTADPNTNWFFTEWTGDITGGVNPETITMDGNKTVTAAFVQGWDATLIFSANIASTRTDNLTFGESGLALDGIDDLDQIKCPSPPGAPYIYAWFNTSLGGAHDVLWKEYREFPADAQVWNVKIEVDNTITGQTTWVTITWNTAEIIDSGYQYVGLHDYSGAFIRNMKTTDHYSFEADNGWEQHFKIVCSNICPEALDDGPYTVNEATTLYVPSPGVLVNDVDDGLPGPLTAHLATDVSDGTLNLNADGSFIYTPNLGSVVPDSFTYTAFDGLCHSDPATVDITIIELNHIVLQSGWNLFSNPVDEPIDKTDIIVRLNNIDRTWDQAVACNIIVKFIYGWTVNAYTFEDILVPGEGYWIWSNYDCEFLIPSNVVPDNHITYLDASWNLVGLPNDIDLAKTTLSIQYLGRYYTWDDAVSNGYIVNFVYGWDRINQNYMLSDVFDLGFGYWVYSYVDCALKIS